MLSVGFPISCELLKTSVPLCLRALLSLAIRQSSFVVRRSSLVFRCSPFVVRRSSLVLIAKAMHMYRISAILAAAGLLLIVGSAFAGPAPTPAPTLTIDLVAQGRAVFVTKGCVSCHRHAALPNSGPFSGDDVPDLSAPRTDADFLRRWLSNPAAVKPNTYMPKLNLSNAEMDALIAFLGHG